ncbi:hypothetical protein ACVWZA_001092 [Sphingomonas sp. UYAg733]
MIIQPPAGREARHCSGVLGAGWCVALRLGEGIAVIGQGEADSGTYVAWPRPLHLGLNLSQSG